MPSLDEYAEMVQNLNLVTYIINIIGLIGSVLGFAVFSRKAFSKNSIGVYFKSLAIFDLFPIFNSGFGIVSLIIDYDLFNLTNWACKLVHTASFAISAVPGWILVAFSVDQLILVSNTKRFSYFQTKHFQYWLISGLFFIHLVIYSPSVFYVSSQNVTTANGTAQVCIFDFSCILPAVYLIESSIVPFSIMMITTIWTCKLLFDSRRNLEKNNPSSIQNSSLRKSRDIRFAVNSIILNILFIVLGMPLVIRSYVFPFEDYYENEYYKTICFIFWYINFTSHFFIGLCVNSLFRREFFIMIGFTSSISTTPQTSKT